MRILINAAQTTANNAATQAGENAVEIGNNRQSLANLKEVARSGSYNDLTDKPDIPSGGGAPADTQEYNQMLLAPSQDVRVYRADNFTETIPRVSALEGDYFLVLGYLDDPGLATATSLEIRFVDSEGNAGRVDIADWTLVQGRRVVAFDISDIEISGPHKAAERVRRDDKGRLHFQVRVDFFRLETIVATMEGKTLYVEDEIVTFPTTAQVGERINEAISSAGIVDQKARDSALQAETVANAASARAIRNSALITALGTHLRFDPDYLVRENTPAGPGSVTFRFDSTFLPSGANALQFELGGFNLGRKARLGSETYTFSIPQADYQTLSRAHGGVAVGRLTFWSAIVGGVQVGDSVHESLRLVNTDPFAGGGGGSAPTLIASEEFTMGSTTYESHDLVAAEHAKLIAWMKMAGKRSITPILRYPTDGNFRSQLSFGTMFFDGVAEKNPDVRPAVYYTFNALGVGRAAGDTFRCNIDVQDSGTNIEITEDDSGAIASRDQNGRRLQLEFWANG